MDKYEPVIGMEIHAELATVSKMFCGCKNDPFGAKRPNIYTCPVCLGLPGALPVPNKKAIDWTIMLGLALNCKIAQKSKFDRKHYFYPDLPKGYQISQYDEPLCFDGWIETTQGKVRITRVHLEEDTGKLKHAKVAGKNKTLIDFNRSGVPLVEIVTEPDIASSVHAKEFLKKIHNIIKALGISTASMETGSMRLEANISLREIKQESSVNKAISKIENNPKLPDYKIEVKNLNSFNFVKKAIDYEQVRQSELLEKGKVPMQETRGWDEKANKTVAQRSKETSEDYRYFPDPDIPPLEIDLAQIQKIRLAMPKTPDIYKQELLKIGVREDQAELLSKNTKMAVFTINAIKNEPKLKDMLVNKIIKEKLTGTASEALKLVEKIKSDKKSTVDSEDTLVPIVDKIIKQNKKAVADYLAGNENVVGFLVGQVMSKTKGKAKPSTVIGLIKKLVK